MRLGSCTVVSLAAWLALGACSGGYPLPPTRCDELCDATKGDTCQEYYDPAGCVAQCERNSDAPAACRAQLDAVIRCFHEHPEALDQRCSYGGVPACASEQYWLGVCAHPDFYANVPPPGQQLPGQ